MLSISAREVAISTIHSGRPEASTRNCGGAPEAGQIAGPKMRGRDPDPGSGSGRGVGRDTTAT